MGSSMHVYSIYMRTHVMILSLSYLSAVSLCQSLECSVGIDEHLDHLRVDRPLLFLRARHTR